MIHIYRIYSHEYGHMFDITHEFELYSDQLPHYVQKRLDEWTLRTIKVGPPISLSLYAVHEVAQLVIPVSTRKAG